MTLRTIVITTIVCTMTICALAQNKGYTISGNIKNLPDGVIFYLIHNKDGGGADTVSRVKSKDHRFSFREVLKDDGQLRFVKMDTSIVKLSSVNDSQNKKRKTWLRLFVDNSGSDIKLTGDIKAWPEIDVQGSPLTEQHDKFVLGLETPMAQFNERVDAANRDSTVIAEAQKVYEFAYLKNLEQFSDSYVLPFFLFVIQRMDLKLKENAYQKLSEKLKSSYYGKRLNLQIASMKASKDIGIGKVIPDFQIKTPGGKLESIRKLAMKSKYTLVDFWASWCKPCRNDIPNLKKVYSAFIPKGFNILSVSTDSNLKSWQKALKEENTPWTNGIQEGRPSKDIFGLISIPAYILLNDKAEIVQMDLNSSFFSKSVGMMGGAQVFIKDSNKRGLRGDDLYQVIEGLLGKAEASNK